MCSPSLLGVGSLATQAVSGGYSAYQAATAGYAKSDYYKFIAKQADQMAEAVTGQGELTAGLAQKQGAIQAKQVDSQGKQILGKQVAAFAANGVDGGSVSAQDVAQDSINKTNQDQDTIKYNADQASFQARTNAEMQSMQYKSKANMDRISAGNAEAEGNTNAINSILGTATSVASSWYKMNQEGVFNPAKTYEVKGPAPFNGSAEDFFAPSGNQLSNDKFEFGAPRGGMKTSLFGV